MNRISHVKGIINKINIDAVLITDPCQLFYLINFSGSSGALLILSDMVYFFTDRRYTHQSYNEIGKDINIEIYQNNLIAELSSKINKLSINNLAILENFISYNFIDQLHQSLPALKIHPLEQMLISDIYKMDLF